ncbi:DUF4232 domain-containing protein [Streptomyces sp. NPDC051597]|uniref:DUF4232 domain-containing protein n=1 Tax=Streptomyces sp. NPDC051597 TaxID=3155049 RepID=UPI00343767BB
MRRAASLLSAVGATALLLTSCGTESAGVGASGARASVPPSRPQVQDPGKDGVRITSLTLTSPSPYPTPTRRVSVSADSLALDSGDAIASFEVTNEGTQTLTYSVVITFMSSDGGAVASQTTTVRNVGPGKIVRGTVRTGHLPPSAPRVTRAKVLKVTKVPANEAPAEPGACPASGIRVSADNGDAAMGLRVVGLHLDNCGKRNYSIEGYPLLELLDGNYKTVHGIKTLHGTSEITTGAGPDQQPRPVTLRPGQSAAAALVWRNTTESGTPVNVPYVRVRATTGASPVTLTLNLDLGTTGRLGVKPWSKAEQ